jgi:uncharacterized surface protein with fasciclin (FAS1) repeats
VELYPTKNIVENAVNSKDHTTLVAAVTAAGFSTTLQSKGPFTVFANKCGFDKLPEGTVATLLKPENKKCYKRFYLPCCRKMNASDIAKQSKKGEKEKQQ